MYVVELEGLGVLVVYTGGRPKNSVAVHTTNNLLVVDTYMCYVYG